MADSRKRRIVRRVVMVVAGAVLPPVGYVGSVATLIFLLNAGIVPLNAVTQDPVQSYTAPLWWYMESGWPGWRACDDMLASCKKSGQRMQDR